MLLSQTTLIYNTVYSYSYDYRYTSNTEECPGYWSDTPDGWIANVYAVSINHDSKNETGSGDFCPMGNTTKHLPDHYKFPDHCSLRPGGCGSNENFTTVTVRKMFDVTCLL